MGTPDYFRDRSHLLICGVTGARTDYGGKTALATWWADTHGRAANDVVIFGNYKLDDTPEEHADAVATSVDEVAGAIHDGATFITLSPMDSDWEAVHSRLRAGVDALPSEWDKLVVHDEAPELDEDSLAWFARVAGNGANCKSLFLSQEPGAMPRPVRNQSILTWVGPATERDRHVFRANKRENHFDAIVEQHEPYVWSVLTGPGDEDRDTYDPVPEAYA